MECRSIEVEKFAGDIYKKILAGKIERIPISCIFELTYRCNLRCVHCYCVRDNKKELTKNEIIEIIDQIVNAGTLFITFTGGEIFVKEDYIEIYTLAKKKGLIITLFTNGTLIDENVIKHLCKYPPKLIEITLYGITKKTYESITQVYGSYEKCMKSIEMIIKNKLPLKLKTMLLTLNKHELFKIKSFAKSIGVDFRFDPFILPKNDGDKKTLKYRLPVEEAVELELLDKERRKIIKQEIEKKYGITQYDFSYKFFCGAIYNSFAINPYGNVGVCTHSYFPYNILDYDFNFLWRNIFPKYIFEKKKDYVKMCNSCKLYGFCKQCLFRNKFELENNRNMYNCAHAKLIYKKMNGV
jgi:MoaA/NifB/PqqE/SkfB family radical SAM enzyme